MPEVITVTWNGTAYKVDRPGWDGGKVLTLDQIEEWLKAEKRGPYGASEWLVNKLLAQVQAWRNGAK